jgi:hypothetical protein
MGGQGSYGFKGGQVNCVFVGGQGNYGFVYGQGNYVQAPTTYENGDPARPTSKPAQGAERTSPAREINQHKE